MSTVIQGHNFPVPSTSFQRSQLQRRPTIAVLTGNVDASSSSRPAVPLSTRPRGHSFTHKYRGSGDAELGVLRRGNPSEEPGNKAGSSKTQSRVSNAVPKSRANPPPPLPLEDNYVFVSTSHSSEDVTALAKESPERSKYLSFRIPSSQSQSRTQTQTTESGSDNATTPTQASPRLKDFPFTTAKTEQQSQPSTANKYATFSGGRFASLSRRKGKLSDIYTDSSDAAAQKQLSSPPMRQPGASLPPITTSSPGRRRSSSQPPLPGAISNSIGPLHIRQSFNPSSLSTISTLSQPPSFSQRSSFLLPPHQSLPPQNTTLRPYRLMSLIRTTMTSKSGGYITRRLHVPNEVWLQTGVKLSNLTEKIRIVETLCTGLEEIHMASPRIASSEGKSDGDDVFPSTADQNIKDMERWLHKLDDWNALCDGILVTFGRKLGVREGFVAKKNGPDKVPFWVRSTNFDSMAIYVSGLVKLFHLAQILGEHTKTLLLTQIPPPYASILPHLRQALEIRLKRSSEFFSSVVLTFVTRDLYLLLDKYVKLKVEKWLAE